jgi:hypothetical protein
MPEVKYRDNKSESARINARLAPSNEMETANSHTVNGSGPTRVHTTVHHSASNLEHHNPHSRSILKRADADTDLADVINRNQPKAGPPNFGSFRGGK